MNSSVHPRFQRRREESVSARGRAKAQPAAFFRAMRSETLELSRMIARAKRARDPAAAWKLRSNIQHDADPSILTPPTHSRSHPRRSQHHRPRGQGAHQVRPSKSGGNRSTIGDTPAADGCRCYIGNLAWETNEESLIGKFQPDTPNRADSGRFRATHRAGRARSARFLTSESLPPLLGLS